MMKDLLKKKMQHVINLHIHVNKSPEGNAKEEAGESPAEEALEDKNTDLAPEIKDKMMNGRHSMPPPMHESMMSDQMPVMSPEEKDDDRAELLKNIGADASSKNPRSLRGRAMHAAGQEMERLKSKKKLNKG